MAMSQRKEGTGRDAYVMAEALAFTVEALSTLPIEFRPDNASLGQAQPIVRRRLATLLAPCRASGKTLIRDALIAFMAANCTGTSGKGSAARGHRGCEQALARSPGP